MKAKSSMGYEVRAKITRADGTIEDLGVIAKTDKNGKNVRVKRKEKKQRQLKLLNFLKNLKSKD